MGCQHRDLRDLPGILYRDRHGRDFLTDKPYGLLYAPFEGHLVGACRDVLEAVPNHALGKYRRSRRAVADNVISLAGGDLHELGPNVFEGILQLYLLGDCHTVAADLRRTEVLPQYHISAAWTECDANSPSQRVYPP